MHLGVVVVAQVAPGLILGDGGEGSWHYCRSMQDQGEPRTRSDDHGGHGGHGGGGGVDGDEYWWWGGRWIQEPMETQTMFSAQP